MIIEGNPIAATRPMMATTIMISINVNAFRGRGSRVESRGQRKFLAERAGTRLSILDSRQKNFIVSFSGFGK
jgi:hypothetical protein